MVRKKNITNLYRPRRLVQAARVGLIDYDPQRALPQILGHEIVNASQDAVLRELLEREQQQENLRQNADPSYDITLHIELLVGLMAVLQPPR